MKDLENSNEESKKINEICQIMGGEKSNKDGKILAKWFLNHIEHPYLTKAECNEL